MYIAEEQVSLFDPDIASGKMFLERSVRLEEETEKITRVKTGRRSSRSSSESQTQTLPQFLCLRKGNGTNGADTWEKDLTVGGLLPIASMTQGGMEWRSVGAESVYSLTTADGQRTGYCLTLNTGEMPRNPIKSKLSQILQKKTDARYRLSAKACLGILTRAERRGKELPKELKDALEAQAYEEPKADSCGEGCTVESAPDETGKTVCLEGNGTRESHFGNGWRVSDQMYTLNTTEQHAVAYGIDQQGGKGGANYATNLCPPILSDSHGTPHAVAYGISPYFSNGMLSDNPHSGIYEADTSRTLDLNGGTPACNQGGLAIVETDNQRDGFEDRVQ